MSEPTKKDATTRKLFSLKELEASLTADDESPKPTPFKSPLRAAGAKTDDGKTAATGSEEDTAPSGATDKTIPKRDYTLSNAKDTLTLKKTYSVPLRHSIKRSRLPIDRIEELNRMLKDLQQLIRACPLLHQALTFEYSGTTVDLTKQPFMMTRDAAVLLARRQETETEKEFPNGNAAIDASSPLFASQLLAEILFKLLLLASRHSLT